jgi:hypothetical protein
LILTLKSWRAAKIVIEGFWAARHRVAYVW